VELSHCIIFLGNDGSRCVNGSDVADPEFGVVGPESALCVIEFGVGSDLVSGDA